MNICLGKKAAENGDGDAPAAKKARVDGTEISGYIVQWEWEGDKGTWTRYAENMNVEITVAHNSKKKMVNDHILYSILQIIILKQKNVPFTDAILNK